MKKIPVFLIALFLSVGITGLALATDAAAPAPSTNSQMTTPTPVAKAKGKKAKKGHHKTKKANPAVDTK